MTQSKGQSRLYNSGIKCSEKPKACNTHNFKKKKEKKRELICNFSKLGGLLTI